MTPKQLERIALSLPEATESPHFERRSFRVGTKIFATMTADGIEAMVKVTPPERVELLLSSHPDVFFSYGGWTTRNGSLGVRLAQADPDLLRDLIVESWKSVAPKRAVQSLAAKRRAKKKAKRKKKRA